MNSSNKNRTLVGRWLTMPLLFRTLGLSVQACSGLGNAAYSETGAKGNAYNTTGVLCDYPYLQRCMKGGV